MNDIIVCYTLIDISETGSIKGDDTKRDQQRNWETVLQVLGLKTQPIILDHPSVLRNQKLTEYNFGSFYQGYHSLWRFVFSGERTDFYNISDLEKDFEQVPIILGLEETARFMLPIFHSYGTLKNIYFLTAKTINSY